MNRPYPYARRVEGGILIPKSFHLPDGIIADGHEIVGPDDPRYAELDRILREWDSKMNVEPDGTWDDSRVIKRRWWSRRR